MLRKILERTTGTLTDAEFTEVLDLATTDIKVNHVAYKHNRMILAFVVEIAESCLTAMGRGKVA